MRSAYWRLESKRMFNNLPAILLGGVIVVLLLLGLLKIQQMIENHTQTSKIIPIGLVGDESDRYLKGVINLLEEMDSMKYSCKFEWMNKSQADQALEKGKVRAVFYVPENYVQSLENGSNEPMTIRYGRGQTGIVSLIVKHLAAAASEAILDTQAGIYAMQQYYVEENWLEEEKADEREINIEYLQQVLARANQFRFEEQSDGVSQQLHMVCGIFFFLMLSIGLGCQRLVGKGKNDFCQIMNQRGLTFGSQCLIKYLAFLQLYFVIYILIGITLSLTYCKEYGVISMLFAFWPVPFVTSGIIYLIYSLTKDRFGAIFFLSGLLLVMVFCSGLFYPISAFSKVARVLVEGLPFYQIEQQGAAFLENVEGHHMIGCLLYSIVPILLVFLITIGKEWLRWRKK